MDNEQAKNHDVRIIQPYLEEDLRKIARWTREELFKTCKFLYRGDDDLVLNGTHFKLFERDCVPYLQGVRSAGVVGGMPNRHEYARMAWTLARDKHIINQMLSLRRSCVYTVMCNRFNGKLFSIVSNSSYIRHDGSTNMWDLSPLKIYVDSV